MANLDTADSYRVDPAKDARHRLYARLATASLLACLAMALFNGWFSGWVESQPRIVGAHHPYDNPLLFSICLQGGCALLALILGVMSTRNGFIWYSLAAGLVSFFGGCFEYFSATFGGGAWGRPLRVRGRQLHPELRLGSDWTQGDRPDPRGLDEPTRAALEALWLHDAQKEHASVPAFARLSWLLAAVGAPAELLEWSHRAAMEEIAHTRLCFALAAGYGRRSFTVEPMPDLLLGGLDLKGRPLEVMAIESVTDGCQLEDFNADVAAACAAVCEEPVTRRVLEQIAREERSHAEFSWAMVE
jgi:hypothetical protein